MCGICGYVSNREISNESLQKMIHSITHRGPDDFGIEQFSMGSKEIGLAHRRLSIVDLSKLGHQPMWSNQNDKVVTYNGEIYNFIELRKELVEYGYAFHTNCDTEVLLAAYEQWGTDCVNHFNGMFAFVIIDKSNGMVFAARDRFGKKPFYYYYTEQDFVFASELKPIILYPYFRKKINTAVLGRFLNFGYIHDPDSIFENTYKLPPGSYLLINNGGISIHSYWRPSQRSAELEKNKIVNFDEAKKLLEMEIHAAVKRRMIADVPLGAFLSSGIDSTLVTAVAQMNSSKPISTFTIGFEDRKYNEADVAKEIASYLGTNHHETYISETMLFELIDSIPQYFDEPFGDSSQIPTMLVSQIAKENITVAITGDGGDELFCGYPNYDFVKKAQQYEGIGAILRPLIGANIQHMLPHSVQRVLQNVNPKTKSQMVMKETVDNLNLLLKQPYLPPYYEEEHEIKAKNWQYRRMLLDMETTLPGDMLHKVDRASMKYALETRSPLLDYNIAELSFRMKQEFKYYKKEKKYILKQLAYQYVPQELIDRPKMGFSVPTIKWLKGPLKDRLEQFSTKEYLAKQELFYHDGIRTMLDNLYTEHQSSMNRIVWNYLMFQMWYDTYMC